MKKKGLHLVFAEWADQHKGKMFDIKYSKKAFVVTTIPKKKVTPTTDKK